MKRVSSETPCPICGKPDWCLVARDGTAAICARIEEGALKRARDAGWLHILDGDSANRTFQNWSPPTAPTCHRDWNFWHQRYRVAAPDHINDLAAKLGVSRDALERLEMGFDLARGWWTFPEKDATGRIIGLMGRNVDGEKRRYKGGKCGLVYSHVWKLGAHPILLVEGASDTAALLTMGLPGIGRPSNRGGVELLAELLSDLPADRPIIVIGERDQKPDGNWPGRAGAISTATALAAALEREIQWSLPPDNAKDTRAWLQSVSAILADRWAQLYLDGLNPVSVSPPVRYRYQPPSAETVELDEWRAAMLEARIASLAVPGYYLDASPTGAGKSHIELLVVQHVKWGPSA